MGSPTSMHMIVVSHKDAANMFDGGNGVVFKIGLNYSNDLVNYQMTNTILTIGKRWIAIQNSDRIDVFRFHWNSGQYLQASDADYRK